MLIVFYVVCTLVFSIISYSFYKGMNTTVTSNSGTNLGVGEVAAAGKIISSHR